MRSAGPRGPRTANLHSYWDTAVVEAMGSDPEAIAARLRTKITPVQKAAWEKGEVAALLKFSARTLEDWRSNGQESAYFRINGNQVRYYLSSVRAFLASCAAPGSGA
jgi:hypothetical protein